MRHEQWPRGAGDAATAEIRELLDLIDCLPVPQRERDLFRLELRAGGERAQFARSLLSSAAPLRVGTLADAMHRAHRRIDRAALAVGRIVARLGMDA